MINCLSVWILQSRYILLVSDEDLYGKDSDYDGDDQSMFSNNNRSTFQTSKREEIPEVKSTQLNLEINKTLMRRRLLKNSSST